MTVALAEEYRDDVDDLHARIGDAAGRLARAHADLVEVTADALETGLWAGGGIRSPEHWLQVRAGISPGRARDVVALARRRSELPATLGVMRAGRLGIDQAAVVARHVPAGYDQAAAELAENATVTQLRRVLPRYGYDQAPAPADDDDTQGLGEADTGEDAGDHRGPLSADPDPDTQQPQLSMWTSDGRFHLRYSGPADQGAVIEAAIREAKDALFTAGHPEATLADGLLQVATRSLDAVTSSGRAARYRVHIHLDASTGAAWVASSGNAALPSHMLERVTCNGRIRAIFELEGTPVKIGRSQRIVPEWMKRLVLARDGGCRYPGCTSRHHLDVHHIIHWTRGGKTEPENLVALCAFHHDRHHDGEYGITGNAATLTGLVFTTRGGWPLTPIHPPPATDADHGRGDEANRGRDSGREPPTSWRGPTGETLHTHWVTLHPDRDDDHSDDPEP